MPVFLFNVQHCTRSYRSERQQYLSLSITQQFATGVLPLANVPDTIFPQIVLIRIFLVFKTFLMLLLDKGTGSMAGFDKSLYESTGMTFLPVKEPSLN